VFYQALETTLNSRCWYNYEQDLRNLLTNNKLA